MPVACSHTLCLLLSKQLSMLKAPTSIARRERYKQQQICVGVGLMRSRACPTRMMLWEAQAAIRSYIVMQGSFMLEQLARMCAHSTVSWEREGGEPALATIMFRALEALQRFQSAKKSAVLGGPSALQTSR